MVKVTVKQGSSSCAYARRIVYRYYHLPGSAYEGSGAYARVGPWTCASNSGDATRITGHSGQCTRRGGYISMDI